MRVEIFLYEMVSDKTAPNKISHLVEPKHLGYIEVEKFNAERIFDICNWEHWVSTKPSNLHADISSCNHGLCLLNPITNLMWLAKSQGWLVSSQHHIKNYVQKHQHDILWT